MRLQGDHRVAIVVEGEPTLPGRRSGGAVSRKEEGGAPVCCKPVGKLLEVPQFPQEYALLEQAQIVDRQTSRSGVGQHVSQPFDCNRVRAQGYDPAVDDPLT